MGWFSKKKSGTATVEEVKSKSWSPFQKLKDSLTKTRSKITSRFTDLLSFRRKMDESVLEELEVVLLESDIGVSLVTKIIQDIRDAWKSKEIEDTSGVYDFLKNDLKQSLKGGNSSIKIASTPPTVIMVAGVNGVGKTTSIAKLANLFIKQGRKVMLAAGDTFRAAATEQLDIWSKRIGADIVKHQSGADPAAVTFDALEASLSRGIDVLIVDTAGRLHTHENLMNELSKMKRVITKRIENAPHEVLMVLDATTGQNAISQAKHAVCLASYIFETNQSGHAFIEALANARSRGVEVRVLLDGIGELYSFPRAGRLLKRHKVRVARFIPPRILPPAIHINLRNHRKLLVVDNNVGFTGGMNIGDRHLRIRPDGRAGIADVHFQFTGPIIDQLQQAFDEDWSFATGDETLQHYASHADNGTAICRVITDGPNEDLGKLAMIMTGAVALARRRIAIMTPYFLPPPVLVNALQAAALRGVDVSVILPQQSNQPLAHWATRNMLWELLQYGVHIYYQPTPFAHSKFFLIDDDYAHIGTANLDPRSLRLNFELVVEIFDTAFVTAVDEHFERVRKTATEETLAGVDGRSLLVRLRDATAWLFSPYL